MNLDEIVREASLSQNESSPLPAFTLKTPRQGHDECNRDFSSVTGHRGTSRVSPARYRHDFQLQLAAHIYRMPLRSFNRWVRHVNDWIGIIVKAYVGAEPDGINPRTLESKSLCQVKRNDKRFH